MKLTRFSFIIISSLLFLLFLVGCFKAEKPIIIETEKRLTDQDIIQKNNCLTFLVGCFETPQNNYRRYKPFAEYLEQSLDKKLHLQQMKSNKEVLNLLEKQEVDLAIISDCVYLRLLEKGNSGYEIAMVPEKNKTAKYTANIIVRKDSVIKKFEELEGKKFSAGDELSIVGYYYHAFIIKKLEKNPETFFSKILYEVNYEVMVNHLLNNQVDAACIPSYILDYKLGRKEKVSKYIRVIKKSQGFMRGPLIIKSDLDETLKIKIKAIVKSMNNEEKGRLILNKVGVDKFIEVNESDYEASLKFIKTQD